MSPWVGENEDGGEDGKNIRNFCPARSSMRRGGKKLGRGEKIRGIEINKNRESNFSSEFI